MKSGGVDAEHDEIRGERQALQFDRQHGLVEREAGLREILDPRGVEVALEAACE